MVSDRTVVSEAKAEIMCLRTKRMLESTATFRIEEVGQVYSQTNEFVYLGVNVKSISTIALPPKPRLHEGENEEYLPLQEVKLKKKNT